MMTGHSNKVEELCCSSSNSVYIYLPLGCEQGVGGNKHIEPVEHSGKDRGIASEAHLVVINSELYHIYTDSYRFILSF